MEQFRKILEKDFVKNIQNSGGQIYFVGGAVRDYLLGLEPKDIDLVVTKLSFASLSELLTKFGKIDLVGQSFGIIIFTEKSTGEKYEIALPRKDYKGEGRGHKDIEVYSDPFLPIETDLFRRDFSINSIALDSKLKFIDPYKGRDHIKRQLIQATSPESFTDDPLRMLRGLMFASRLKFALSHKTFKLIKNDSKLIKEISKERILQEFKKVFDKNGDIILFIHQLIQTDLFSNIFGFELSGYEFRFEKCKTLGQFLSLIISKKDEKFLLKFKEEFKIDNDLYKEIRAHYKLFKLKHDFSFDSLYYKKYLFEILQIFPDIIKSKFFLSKMLSDKFVMGVYPKSLKELPISGDDLISLGYEQGEKIGLTLKEILDEVLADKLLISDKEGALKLLKPPICK